MSAVLLPLATWFLWWSWRRKEQLMALFISDRLRAGLLDSYSPRRQRLKAILWLSGLLFLLLALARPQWGFVWEEATQRGRDIVVAIDTSKSMLAEDMAPNRLMRAKLAALDLLRLARNDRLGLVAFAGGAFLQCPLTMDDEVFRQNVNSLNIGIIPQGGTAIAEAIDAALGAFAAEEGDNHKIMVIFTDGEDHESSELSRMIEKARDRNLRVFTVGVGTPAGQILKITDEYDRESFIKDSSGNVVQSKLNEDLLRKIATEANGFYLSLREANAMNVLYSRGIEPLAAGEISSKLLRRRNERFYWPLAISIVLLLIEALLPASAAAGRKTKTVPAAAPKAAVAAMLLVLLSVESGASPSRAYRDFKEGRFKDARNEYDRLLEKNPNDPRLQYNAAAAAYQTGDFDKAAKGFSAAATAPDLELQQRAYYNLGNSNFRLGEETQDPKTKEGLWQQALVNYDAALKLNQGDQDAMFNQQVVRKRLEELKEQQQQQQKQDQKNNEQEKKDQEKGEQQKQDNQNQNEQQKEEQQKQDNSEKNQQDQQQQDSEQQKEQQQQQPQQEQQGEDKRDSQNQGGESESDQQEGDDQKRAQEEARAAQLGQMTPRQAERILDAQKSDEKAMIFQQGQRAKSSRALKDW